MLPLPSTYPCDDLEVQEKPQQSLLWHLWLPRSWSDHRSQKHVAWEKNKFWFLHKATENLKNSLLQPTRNWFHVSASQANVCFYVLALCRYFLNWNSLPSGDCGLCQDDIKLASTVVKRAYCSAEDQSLTPRIYIRHLTNNSALRACYISPHYGHLNKHVHTQIYNLKQ
jgi:hypothetical protein